MGYTIRKSNERAFFDHGWLKTYHTFSFGNFYDPRYMGFRALRVINEDRVSPGEGFPSHSHRDMEIITYVISGELAHKDSLGTVSVLHANELQLMHAGTKITHSEYNPNDKEPVHFLQIWVLPSSEGAAPGYQQVAPKLQKNTWNLLASPDKRSASLRINQDVELYLAEVDPDVSLQVSSTHFGWLQVVTGSVLFNDVILDHGDAVAIDAPATFSLTAKASAKLMFFSLR